MELPVRQSLPGLKPEVFYRRNAYGLRTDAAIPGPKAPGTRRLLCLGASTTDQATQNLEDTWCAKLAATLSLQLRDSGIRIESASYGRGGYRSVDLLAWAEDSLLAIEPDVVVVLTGINDLAWNGGPGYRYQGLDSALAHSRRVRGPKPERPPGILRRACPVALQLCQRLALAVRGRPSSLEWHSANLPRLRRDYRRLPAADTMTRDPDPIVEFREATDSLLGFLGARGIAAVLLGQPVLWSPGLGQAERDALWFGVATPTGSIRPSLEWLAREMERYNAESERMARDRHAAYLDLDRRIPKTLEYFFDDCHFTDRGSDRVAREILPVVRDVMARRSEPDNRGTPRARGRAP
jgi:lysophospholipase L1-like esterase